MLPPYRFRSITTNRGKELEYLLSLPKNFQPGNNYPALLALPPGEQSRELALVYESWLPFFFERGWIVVIPVARDEKLFFQGSERYLPLIMDEVESEINLYGGKFHLFGVSNGGISAFRVATLHHERFHSITVLPGWPKPADEKRLAHILNIPINFLVGELDSRWLAKAESFWAKIVEMGGDATLEIIPHQGHMAFASYPVEILLDVILRNSR
jgi:pimeloyl-ACP methyl ester carboxylesterase